MMPSGKAAPVLYHPGMGSSSSQPVLPARSTSRSVSLDRVEVISVKAPAPPPTRLKLLGSAMVEVVRPSTRDMESVKDREVVLAVRQQLKELDDELARAASIEIALRIELEQSEDELKVVAPPKPPPKPPPAPKGKAKAAPAAGAAAEPSAPKVSADAYEYRPGLSLCEQATDELKRLRRLGRREEQSAKEREAELRGPHEGGARLLEWLGAVQRARRSEREGGSNVARRPTVLEGSTPRTPVAPLEARSGPQQGHAAAQRLGRRRSRLEGVSSGVSKRGLATWNRQAGASGAAARQPDTRRGDGGGGGAAEGAARARDGRGARRDRRLAARAVGAARQQAESALSLAAAQLTDAQPCHLASPGSRWRSPLRWSHGAGPRPPRDVVTAVRSARGRLPPCAVPHPGATPTPQATTCRR